jgi:DNA-directed RNA polymerase specialized sigma24 family protein
MLKEISKLDDQWRKIALKICGDKSTADDVVNDMYLKIYDLKPKKWNKYYISYTMLHIFLNKKKKNKKTLYLEDVDIANKQCDDQQLKQRYRLLDILKELDFFDREILMHTHENSLRKKAKVLNISHVKLHYQKKLAMEKLLKTDGVKQLLNERQEVLRKFR